ncbi:Na+ ATPase [Lobaria immixta]|nr:Na+ ATPase [Lobaria immixta]
MQLTPFPIPGGITATASVAGSTTNQEPRGRRNFTESQTLLLGPSSSCLGVLGDLGVLGVPEKAWRQVRWNHVHVSNSTGIAIIPESLVTVLTITMVVGMTQMCKRRVVIRQLSALEAHGGVTNICSDKTGTLTQGQTVTRKAWIPGVGIYTVDGAEETSNPPKGTVSLRPATRAAAESDEKRQQPSLERITEEPFKDQLKGKESEKAANKSKAQPPELTSELEGFLQSTALCNLATVRHNSQENGWQPSKTQTRLRSRYLSIGLGWEIRRWKAIRGHNWPSVLETAPLNACPWFTNRPTTTRVSSSPKARSSELFELCVHDDWNRRTSTADDRKHPTRGSRTTDSARRPRTSSHGHSGEGNGVERKEGRTFGRGRCIY